MSIIQTQAIILHKLPYSESSLIIKAYTQQTGQTSFMVKGAKRMKSKFRGLLDTFSLYEFIYNDSSKGDLKLLQDSSSIHHYNHIKSNLTRQAVGSILMEIYLRHLYGPETSIPLFELLKNTLENLNRQQMDFFQFPILLCDFIIQFCGLMGFCPQFKSCVHCEKEVLQRSVHFDLEMGGPVCKSCAALSSIKLQPQPSPLFLWLQHIKDEGVTASPLSKRMMTTAESMLLQFLYTHSSRNHPLKSYNFYLQIL